MNLKKIVKIDETIEEIKKIVLEKTNDFNLNANTHQLIYLEDTETFEAHYTMDFIRLSISHFRVSETILISYESINTFLLGLKEHAKNYSEGNFVDSIGDF